MFKATAKRIQESANMLLLVVKAYDEVMKQIDSAATPDSPDYNPDLWQSGSLIKLWKGMGSFNVGCLRRPRERELKLSGRPTAYIENGTYSWGILLKK